MSRIVVGVSCDHTDDAGLMWALREAAVVGSPVVAVHAWPAEHYVVDLSVAVTAPRSESERRARGRLDAVIAAARSATDVAVAVEPVVAAGRAADVLADATDSDDVLVLTRQHVGPLSRLVHGSVSTGLLRRALCAAVVVPAGWRPTAVPRRVIVGVDRSSGSLRALTWAATEAEQHAVPLVVVLVRSMLDGGLLPGAADADRTDLERWTGQLDLAGEVHLEVRAGDPGQVLVQLAGADDLLVIGRTGVGAQGLADRILGSTSLHVVRHAGCPVVVTPA